MVKVQKAPVDDKLPTSHFVLQGIYDQKPSCNYEITNKLFHEKRDDFTYSFIAILNHFVFL